MKVTRTTRTILSILIMITICTASFARPTHAEGFIEELKQTVEPPDVNTNGELCSPLGENQAPAKLQLVDVQTAEKFSNIFTSADFAEFHRQLSQDFPNIFQPRADQMTQFAYEDKISVVVPIEGGAGYSYYAEWYELASATLLGSVAGLFTETATGNIAVKLYVDSQLRFDAIMTPEGLFVEAYQVQDGEYTAITLPNQQKAVSSWWNCFTTCLSNDEVPGWVSGLIATGCGVLCLVAPTWACQSCMIVLPLIPYFPRVWRCWESCSPTTLYLPLIQNGAVTIAAQ